MPGSTITQRIALEGAEQIKQALAQIGKTGQDAFAQIQQAGEKINLDRSLGSIDASAKRTGASVEEMNGRLANAGGAFAAAGTAAQVAGSRVGTAAGAMSGAERAGAAMASAVIGIGAALRSIGSAVTTGAAHFTNLNFGIDTIAAGFRTAAGEILKTTAVLGALPGALFALAKSAASTASEIRNTALAAGTSTTAYQEFAAAAGRLGTDQDKLGRAFAVIGENAGEIQRTMIETQKANARFFLTGNHSADQLNQHFLEMRQRVQDAGGAFQRYGIALTVAGGRARDPIEVFKDVADQIARIPDPADQAARAIELFGKRVGPQLVPLLSKGSEGIRKIAQDMQSQGLILSPMQIAVGVEMNRAVGQLHLSLSRLKDSIGLLFAPQFTEAANMFRNAIAANRTSLILFASEIATKTRPVLLDFVRALTGQDQDIRTGWILTAKAQFLELGSAISTVVSQVIVPALKILAGLMQGTADAINAVFGTKITPADIAVTLVVTKLVGGLLSLLGVLAVVRGAWGIVLRIVAALGGPLSIVLTAFRALGGIIGVVARGAVALVAALGGLTVLIAGIGFAIGFLAVRLAQGIDWAAFAQKARDAVNAIGHFFAGLAEVVVDKFNGILAGASGLWAQVAAIWNAGVAAVSGLMGQVASAATTALTLIATGAQTIWEQIAGLWQQGVALINSLWQSVGTAAQSAWEATTSGASALWTAITGLWTQGSAAMQAVWDQIKSAAASVWQGINDGVTAMWGAITGVWNSGINAIIGFLDKLKSFAVGVWNAIKSAAAAAFGVEQQAAAGASAGFASGGAVVGRGTSTSDSIPAWLSNGEFVVRAAAVRKYGLSLFDALNRMRLDPGAFQRFAEGGLVRSLQVLMPQPLHFAEGGLVPQIADTASLRPINLTIGADTFAGLLAPEDVAQKLMRLAVTKQIRSAGRRPGYYGSGR